MELLKIYASLLMWKEESDKHNKPLYQKTCNIIRDTIKSYIPDRNIACQSVSLSELLLALVDHDVIENIVPHYWAKPTQMK